MSTFAELIKKKEKDEHNAINGYYHLNREHHESWFLNGLGAEMATGSRVMGSLAVADVNEKNRAIDKRNANLKAEIMKKVHDT